MTRSRRLILLVALVAFAAACGSDGDDSGDAAEVETSLEAQLEAAEGGGVVQLDGDVPRRVTCEKDARRKNGWRCRVTTTGNRTIVCIVKTNPDDSKVEQRVCAPADY